LLPPHEPPIRFAAPAVLPLTETVTLLPRSVCGQLAAVGVLVAAAGVLVGVHVRVGVGDERFLAAALLAAVTGDAKHSNMTGRVMFKMPLKVIVYTTPHAFKKIRQRLWRAT
jgi:hypothetical protein